MSALEVFNYGTHEVRTVVIDGEPWFVAADICRALEIGNPTQALTRLDDDEVTLISNEGRQVNAVNEPGMYSLILGSRKPDAREFKRWVTHEVLPTIRRTGQFGSALPTNFAEALELAAAEARRIETLEAKVAEDAPKVAAYDALMDADGYYPMDVVAKIAGTGRTRLYAALRDAGVIERGSTQPYQRYMHHFVITVSTWSDREGNKRVSHTTRVRPSGLPFILSKVGAPALTT